jgi:hypothetical protein
MAAWLLIRTGEKEKGFQALEGVLRENGYAMLTAMNDRLDRGGGPAFTRCHSGRSRPGQL